MIVRLAFVTTDEETPVLHRELIGAILTVVPLAEPQIPFTSVPPPEPPPLDPPPELPLPEPPPLFPHPEPPVLVIPVPVPHRVPPGETLVVSFVAVVVMLLRGIDRLVLVVEAIA